MDTESLGHSIPCQVSGRMGRASKHDAGFHLNWLPVLQVPPELPLPQGIGNGLCLIGKCAEKVNVFYLALSQRISRSRSEEHTSELQSH